MEPAPASVLLHALARHSRRQRGGVALRAAAAGVIVWAVALPLLIGIDLFAAPLTLRWTTWIIAIITSASVIAWQGRALARHGSLVDLAKNLEQRAGIESGLLSAGTSFSQQAPRDASEWMINRTVMLAAKAAADIHDWSRISPVPWRLPLMAAAMGTCLLISASFSEARPWLERALFPGSASGRPGDLQVITVGGDRRVAAGSEPELAVEVTAGTPSQVTASITWKDGRTERRPLSPVGETRWHLTLPPVTTALTWQVEAYRQPGGPVRGESDRRRISLTPGLMPAGFQLRVIPPAYTNLPSQTATGDCTAVAGSRIELEATISAPEPDLGTQPHLVAATVVIESDDGAATIEIPATITGATLHANWIVRRSQRWGLRLIAGGGSETLPNRRWLVTVANDLAPKIHLTAVPATLAADALTTVMIAADDDVALAETLLEVRRDHGNGALLIALPVSGDTPRRRLSEVVIDGAALGLMNGDTLALVPVASDRAGQTTRGEPLLVTVTADGPGWAQRAEHLARLGSATEAATTSLTALSDAWDRCGLDPTTRAVLGSRLTSWQRALTDACEPWPPLADVPTDQAARQAVADLSWWVAHAVSDVLADLTPVGEPALPLTPGRLRFTADELHQMATLIQPHRDAIARAQFQRAAEAHEIAARHHAAVLRADLAWQTPPRPGLIARFSADHGDDDDADDATPAAGGIEAPAVDGRELPGLGRNHIRIRWEGAVLVPRADLELEFTADDGVAVTIAGSERLPADAWGDHPPTTWKSGPLAVGWQPLTIRWRQGAGGSFLRVAWTGSATPIAIDELRAVQIPEYLMSTEASAVAAHTAALEHQLLRLAQGVGPAAQALSAPRIGPWTAESLTQALALADQVASQQPDVADAINPSGPLAVSLDLADRALIRARIEPLSPAGRQAVAVALSWLAHAADAAGVEPGTGSKRLRSEVIRVAARGANSDASSDTSAEIKRVENECARLRKSLKPSAPEPEIVAPAREAAILAGRDQARTALAVACGTLALELRESVSQHPANAETFEALEARLRSKPAATEPPLTTGDANAVSDAKTQLTALALGRARDAATVALAQAPGGPSDGAARRLAAAIAHLSAACRRLDTLTQRPITAVPALALALALASEPPTKMQGVTDAGFARARLQAPTLSDRGIDGFRPDQQTAIRAYLARMRQHPPGAP